MPLSKMAADPVSGHGMRMVKVEEAERQQLHQQVAAVHQFREQRLQQERQGASRTGRWRCRGARPRPMNLPHSPIASRPANPAGSQAAVAHRTEGEHSAASRAEPAGRSDMLRERAGTSRLGQGAEPPEQQPRIGTARPGTTRPATRPSARAASSADRNRERARSTEEEERRRRSP